MKTAIERAIKDYIIQTGTLLVDGNQIEVSQNPCVRYITSDTSSPYDSDANQNADSWEKEREYWLAGNPNHTTFEGNVFFELNGTRYKSTSFDYEFVEDNSIKMRLNYLACTKV
jgi:hypothetical protein